MFPFKPPAVCPPLLSGDEADEANHLSILLHSLGGYSDQFRSALALFDFCEAELHKALSGGDWDAFRPMLGWPIIASRDAAMSIYHFGVTLAALHSRIGLCPTLFPHFDLSHMRAARRAFNDNFRHSTKMRHSISHSADNMKSPDKFLRHAARDEDAPGLYIHESLNERTFQTTYQGERLSVDITDETLEALTAIEHSVFAAFRPIEALYEARPRRGSKPGPDRTNRR